jgi:predicted nucleotidyltransferase
MRIRRDDVIAGMDALGIRGYLRKYNNRGITYITAMETFSISKRRAEELIKGLVKLRLISKCDSRVEENIVHYETTVGGNALTMAKAGRPVSRVSAERILREFLNRVRLANERSELAFSIESAVVFGSYLTDRAHINDLDVAVELESKESNNRTFEEYRKARLAAAPGRRFASYLEQLDWPKREVIMFLKNRSRAISLCELKDLFEMPDLQYSVLIGDTQRIQASMKYGKLVDRT